MKLIRLNSVFLFLLFYISVSGQLDSTRNEFTPSVTLYSGYLVPNFDNVPRSGPAIFGSFSAIWQTNGKDFWHRYYKHPQIGAEFFFSSFGNKNELGFNIGFVPVLNLNKQRKNSIRIFKFGMGAAYFTKPYDPISNPTNLYMGAKVANMTIAAVSWQHSTKNNFGFFYGFNFAHCSDGHSVLPNAGMNFLLAHAGIKFNTKNSRHFKLNPDTTTISKARFYTARIGLGFHEFGETTKAIGGPSYPSYHVSFATGKPFRRNQIVQLGIICSYYSGFYDYIINQQFYSSKEKLNSGTVVLTLGHEFIMGKISFSAQFGVYVYNKFYVDHKKQTGDWKGFSEKFEGYNTNRLGLIYYPFKKQNSLNQIKKQLSMGIFIKANFGQADLFEYALAYTF